MFVAYCTLASSPCRLSEGRCPRDAAQPRPHAGSRREGVRGILHLSLVPMRALGGKVSMGCCTLASVPCVLSEGKCSWHAAPWPRPHAGSRREGVHGMLHLGLGPMRALGGKVFCTLASSLCGLSEGRCSWPRPHAGSHREGVHSMLHLGLVPMRDLGGKVSAPWPRPHAGSRREGVNSMLLSFVTHAGSRRDASPQPRPHAVLEGCCTLNNEPRPM